MPQKYRVTTDQGQYEVTVADQEPFDINASREKLAAANAAYEAHPPQSEHPGSEWTGEKMMQRGVAGAKGELEGAAGGLLGLASLPVAAYTALRHLPDTAKAVGGAALVGGMALKRAYDQPGQTATDVGHAVTRWASDPEHIGQAAGATGVALATGRVGQSLPGRMVKAGVSDFAENTRGVKAMKRVWDARGGPPLTGTLKAAPVAAPVAAAEAAPAAVSAPTSAIDPATLARLTRQGYPPELIAKIDAAAGGSGVTGAHVSDVTTARRQIGAEKLGRIMHPTEPSAVATGKVLRADPSGAGSAMPDTGQAALLRDIERGTSAHPEMFQRALGQVIREYDRNQGVANSPGATEVAKRIRDLLIERLKGTD